VSNTSSQPSNNSTFPVNIILPNGFSINNNEDNVMANMSSSRRHSQPAMTTGTAVGGQTLTLEHLRKYFHLPIAEVAKKLKTCTTALKKICRRLNITKWPYRQILSLTKSIQSLEMACLNEHLEEKVRIQYRKQINVLKRTISEVLNNPSKIVMMDSLNKFADDEFLEDETNQAYSNITTGATTTSTSNSSGEEEKDDDPNVTHVIQAASALISTQSILDKTSSSGSSTSSSVSISTAAMYTGTADISTSQRSTYRNRTTSTTSTSSTKAVARGVYHHDDEEEDDDNDDSDEEEEEEEEEEEIQRRNKKRRRRDSEISTTNTNAAHSLLPPSLGNTIVCINYHDDNEKLPFLGPVQLAPLQRMKLRGVGPRRVVPLMEPDLSSQFHIEFTPAFITSLLHKSLVDRHAVSSHTPFHSLSSKNNNNNNVVSNNNTSSNSTNNNNTISTISSSNSINNNNSSSNSSTSSTTTRSSSSSSSNSNTSSSNANNNSNSNSSSTAPCLD
jgi:hypothetical protein